MKRYRYQHKETIVTILVEDDRYYDVAVNAILEARKEIESVIRSDPFFFSSLEPYNFYEGAVTRRMVEAAEAAGLGPMASVAGMISQFAVEKMVEEGADFAVVDNGGDMAIYSQQEMVIGVYTGTNMKLGFKIEPPEEIRAICTSSGRIGHSISFGYADAATVFGDDACVADAFATALGNEIKEEVDEENFTSVMEEFWERCKDKDYVEGIFAVKGELMGFAGNVPEVVRAEVDPDLITRG
ncbi:MAG: UPF0280 family protein [Archaeoglobaceae archaeon]